MFQYEEKQSQNREKEIPKISSYLKSLNSATNKKQTQKQKEPLKDLNFHLKEGLEQKLGMKLESILTKNPSKDVKASERPMIDSSANKPLKQQMKQIKTIALSPNLLQKAEKRYKTRIINDIEIYEGEGLQDLGFNGYTNGKEIYIDSNLSSQEREATILHEIGHIVQLDSNMVHGSGLLDNSTLEQQADKGFIASKEVVNPKVSKNSIIMPDRRFIDKDMLLDPSDYQQPEGSNSCWLKVAAYCLSQINRTQISEKDLINFFFADQIKNYDQINNFNWIKQGSAIEAIIKYYDGYSESEEIQKKWENLAGKDDHPIPTLGEIQDYFSNQLQNKKMHPLACCVSAKPPVPSSKEQNKNITGGHWVAIVGIINSDNLNDSFNPIDLVGLDNVVNLDNSNLDNSNLVKSVAKVALLNARALNIWAAVSSADVDNFVNLDNFVKLTAFAKSVNLVDSVNQATLGILKNIVDSVNNPNKFLADLLNLKDLNIAVNPESLAAFVNFVKAVSKDDLNNLVNLVLAKLTTLTDILNLVSLTKSVYTNVFQGFKDLDNLVDSNDSDVKNNLFKASAFAQEIKTDDLVVLSNLVNSATFGNLANLTGLDVSLVLNNSNVFLTFINSIDPIALSNLTNLITSINVNKLVNFVELVNQDYKHFNIDAINNLLNLSRLATFVDVLSKLNLNNPTDLATDPATLASSVNPAVLLDLVTSVDEISKLDDLFNVANNVIKASTFGKDTIANVLQLAQLTNVNNLSNWDKLVILDPAYNEYQIVKYDRNKYRDNLYWCNTTYLDRVPTKEENESGNYWKE